jgi:hypothetical protein
MNHCRLEFPPKRQLIVLHCVVTGKGIGGHPAVPCAVRYGYAGMKAKPRRGREGNNRVSRDEQVRIEIQSFLLALASYPDRFSREPRISFEEHRLSIGRGYGRSQLQSRLALQQERIGRRVWPQSD